MRKLLLSLAALAAVGAASLGGRAWWHGRSHTTVVTTETAPQSPHPRDVYARPGRIWFLGDGITDPESRAGASSATILSIFNPQPEEVVATVRVFLANEAPRTEEVHVPAGKIATPQLQTLAGLPPDTAYWLSLDASAAVIPQLRHESFAPADPVPDALVGVAPYPGPLQDETAWLFPDGFAGSGNGCDTSESITILNPGEQTATVRIRYALSNGSAAEEQIEIPPQRLFALDVRQREPRAEGIVLKIVDRYATRIDSSVPVIAQQTRRVRRAERPGIVAARGTIGVALRGPGHNLWYYPGGELHPRGGKAGEYAWNQLFTYGLGADPTSMELTFYPAGMEVAASEPLAVPGQRSDLQSLHLAPWLGKFTSPGNPFGLSLSADAPVVPAIATTEYEADAPGCPGGMAAVAPYPGPLLSERTWWLGIAEQGTSPRHKIRWLQSYLLLNPSSIPIQVTLTISTSSGERALAPIEVGPESMARVESSDIEGMPLDQPFSIRAAAEDPFVAQVTVRAFRAGQSSPRSMYSMMGLPMQLGAD